MHDVTIIIPVYCTTKESLKWLDECIASAVIQNCNVMIWDDGSPISIDKIVSNYIDGDRFECIMAEHNGVSYARNHAISNAKTSLILPLDCDDTFKPGAVDKLMTVWNGTPLYCDVAKFGDVTIPHYVLLDFDCLYIRKFVGFSSVNVLHSVEQWKSVGGYNTELDFYEDGEYNARLFSRYCGQRCPEPLVNYRIHKGQRTDQYKKVAHTYAKTLLKRIGEYEMACPGCNKGRRSAANAASNQFTGKAVNMPMTMADVSELPLTQGLLVLAQYIGGKGRGKHYYEGHATKTRYKVTYGMYVYVSAEDTKLTDEFRNNSLLIRVVETAPKVVKPVEPVTQPMPLPEPTLLQHREKVKGEAVVVPVHVVKDLPDIANMTVKQIYNSDEVTADNAAELLALEINGLNRGKVVDHLQKLAK